MKKALILIAAVCLMTGGIALSGGEPDVIPPAKCGIPDLNLVYSGYNQYMVYVTNDTGRTVNFDLFQSLSYWTSAKCVGTDERAGLAIGPKETKAYCFEGRILCLWIGAPPGMQYGRYTVTADVNPGNCSTSETLTWGNI